MMVDLQLAPKQKRAAGEPCCQPVVYPDVERHEAERMAGLAKAPGEPIRLQLVDVLRKHAGRVCVCELVPLFDVSQPTLSHHLKKLRDAGIVDSERQGLWAYYYVIPAAMGGLTAWLRLRKPTPFPTPVALQIERPPAAGRAQRPTAAVTGRAAAATPESARRSGFEPERR